MSVFERYLTLWVFACIGVGILLGQALPALFHAVGSMEVAQVNLPVAILIWLMIIPMLLKIELKEIKGVRRHWRGVGGDPVRQLGSKAVLHGAARLSVHR